MDHLIALNSSFSRLEVEDQMSRFLPQRSSAPLEQGVRTQDCRVFVDASSNPNTIISRLPGVSSGVDAHN